RELYRMAPGATPFQRKLLAPLAELLGANAFGERLKRPESAASPEHAEQYRRWKELPKAKLEVLVAEAARLREDELLLAIFSRLNSGGRELPDSGSVLQRVQQLGDPFVTLLAKRLLGLQQEGDAGKMDEALKTFQDLAEACEPGLHPYRCSELE